MPSRCPALGSSSGSHPLYLSLSLSLFRHQLKWNPAPRPSVSPPLHPSLLSLLAFPCFDSSSLRRGMCHTLRNVSLFCGRNKPRLYWRLECVFVLTAIDGICRISGLHDQQQLVTVGNASVISFQLS